MPKKYISFYQYDLDDPAIIIFDTRKEALGEARKNLEYALDQEGEDTGTIGECLKEFDRKGHSNIEGYVIFAAECEYRPGKRGNNQQTIKSKRNQCNTLEQ